MSRPETGGFVVRSARFAKDEKSGQTRRPALMAILRENECFRAKKSLRGAPPRTPPGLPPWTRVDFCLRPCGPASRFLSWVRKFPENPALDFYLLISKATCRSVISVPSVKCVLMDADTSPTRTSGGFITPRRLVRVERRAPFSRPLRAPHTGRTRYITVNMLPCFTARSPMLLLPITHATAPGVHGMQAPLHGNQPYTNAMRVSTA